MQYYPIFLDIKGRNCLVVGGGDVGTRKVEMLLKCGALVTVVSIDATETLKRLIRRPTHHPCNYVPTGLPTWIADSSSLVPPTMRG